MINAENAARGVIIKTFVTTDLQKAIAEQYGLRCVETLTGFKYIGEKLGKYERALPADVARQIPATCRRRDAAAAARSIALLRLRRRGKLRLQRRRFRARQGWQRRRDHVLRSGGLREVARANARCAARRNLTRPSATSRRRTAR